jgi:hypothetical protein
MKEKKKSALAAAAQSTEDKLALLEVLLESEVLTQEEFDSKKEKLLGA